MFRIGTPRAQDDIWALPLPSGPGGPGAKPFPVIEGPGNQRTAALSPDGKWIAYSSTESGPPEVYVVPFSGSGTTGGKRQVSTQGGNRPRWRRDGKELFYTFGDQVWAAEVNVNGAAIEIGRVRKLFDVGSPISAFDVFADGQKFILARGIETATAAAQPLTLVQNWTLKLRK